MVRVIERQDRGKNLINLFLTNYEDFWGFPLFLAIAVFLYSPTNVLKVLRSLGKSRESQKSSLISEEKVNKTTWAKLWAFLATDLAISVRLASVSVRLASV